MQTPHVLTRRLLPDLFAVRRQAAATLRQEAAALARSDPAALAAAHEGVQEDTERPVVMEDDEIAELRWEAAAFAVQSVRCMLLLRRTLLFRCSR